MFEVSVDVHDADLELFHSPSASSEDLQEHLSYMVSGARRNTEVNIKNCTREERKWIEEAKK